MNHLSIYTGLNLHYNTLSNIDNPAYNFHPLYVSLFDKNKKCTNESDLVYEDTSKILKYHNGNWLNIFIWL